MTTIYLCIGGNSRVVQRTLDTEGCPPMHLLASYYCMKGVKLIAPAGGKAVAGRGATDHLRIIEHPRCASWVLDCGAFSAMNEGMQVDIDAYIDYCLKLREHPKPPVDVFALDVIGDWRATEKNFEKMLAAGVKCIPTFHRGSPVAQLDHLASTCEKVAFGGIAGWRGKARVEYVQRMLARVWPKKVHGFGITATDVLFGAPLHSSDSTSWVVGPVQGNWAIYKSQINPVYSKGDLVPVVKHFHDLERRVQAKWNDELAKL